MCNCNPRSACCAEAEYLTSPEGLEEIGKTYFSKRQQAMNLTRKLGATDAMKIGAYEVLASPKGGPYTSAMVYSDATCHENGRRSPREEARHDVAVVLGLKRWNVSARSKTYAGYPGPEAWEGAKQVSLRLDLKVGAEAR